LGNLSSLTYLYLSNNQLTGTIPTELVNLSILRYLYLSNNQLTGTIPISLMTFPLNRLLLNNNCLTIPDDPELIAFLDRHDHNWATTQTNCSTTPTETGVLQFSPADYSIEEETGTVTLTVTRDGGSTGILEADYTTQAGTATEGSDYVYATGRLTWADGDSDNKTLTITFINDAKIENDETFTVTLSDTNGTSLSSATVTITDSDVPCPTSGPITYSCDAQGNLLTDTTVPENVQIEDAVFEGTIHNNGEISNPTIQTDTQIIGGSLLGTIINNGLITDVNIKPNAQVIGGTVSSNIVNEGLISDFDFCSDVFINGGTLSGTISLVSCDLRAKPESPGGLFRDVHLADNTHITGARLEGVIMGDVEVPAGLDIVEIRAQTQISGVIISETVLLGEGVVFGEGVRFTDVQLIPQDLELTALLPSLPQLTETDCATLLKQVKRVNLKKDVLEPSNGLLAAINAIPIFKDNGWVLSQEANCGALQLTLGTVHFAVQALSVKRMDNKPAGIELLDQQRVRFITETGLMLLAHPAMQASGTLQTNLTALGLPDVSMQSNGNLRIPLSEGNWICVRPDWSSIESSEATENGIGATDSPYLNGVPAFYVTFTDGAGSLRRQFFHSAQAQPEVLYSFAQENGFEMKLEPYGLVNVEIGQKLPSGVVDYLVTSGTPPADGKLQIQPISDQNGDGKEDLVLIYPNGERQKLFRK
jgi:hypothetical protein